MRREMYWKQGRGCMFWKNASVLFLRISRSVILNLDRVKRYRPLINGLMEVKLENGELVYISRKYLREVRDRILDSINEGGISDDKEKLQE